MNVTFINKAFTLKHHEEKLAALEEERADALEMAAEAHEERKEAQKGFCLVLLAIILNVCMQNKTYGSADDTV